MKFDCAICIFLNSENLICRSTDSRSVSEGPFNFEITRVDCSSGIDFCAVYARSLDEVCSFKDSTNVLEICNRQSD